MPAETSFAAAPKMSASASPLLMTARRRSDPASGAMVKLDFNPYWVWKNGKAIKPKSAGDSWNMEEITRRLILRLLNESVSCLNEGVVTDADLLDAGMIFGTGFAPFRGGPLHYLESRAGDSSNTSDKESS